MTPEHKRMQETRDAELAEKRQYKANDRTFDDPEECVRYARRSAMMSRTVVYLDLVDGRGRGVKNERGKYISLGWVRADGCVFLEWEGGALISTLTPAQQRKRAETLKELDTLL